MQTVSKLKKIIFPKCRRNIPTRTIYFFCGLGLGLSSNLW